MGKQRFGAYPRGDLRRLLNHPGCDGPSDNRRFCVDINAKHGWDGQWGQKRSRADPERIRADIDTKIATKDNETTWGLDQILKGICVELIAKGGWDGLRGPEWFGADTGGNLRGHR